MALGEPSEEECESCIEEELVPYLLIVVVHRLSCHLVQPLEILKAFVFRFVRSIEVDKHRDVLLNLCDRQNIILVGTRLVIGENRKVVIHNLFSNSLEACGVLWQEWTSLLVSREVLRQQTLQPVLEGPEEDLLGDLNDNLFFLTVRVARQFFLFRFTTDLIG